MRPGTNELILELDRQTSLHLHLHDTDLDPSVLDDAREVWGESPFFPS